MSQSKAVADGDRLVWVLDNSHDIVLARMVEAASAVTGVRPEWLDHWRVWASVADLAFEVPRDATPGDRRVLGDLLKLARRAVVEHGDVLRSNLRGWSVLDGYEVSNGFLRYDHLPVAALLDVIDGWTGLIEGSLKDPEGGWWALGWPGGRLVFERRR